LKSFAFPYLFLEFVFGLGFGLIFPSARAQDSNLVFEVVAVEFEYEDLDLSSGWMLGSLDQSNKDFPAPQIVPSQPGQPFNGNYAFDGSQGAKFNLATNYAPTFAGIFAEAEFKRVHTNLLRKSGLDVMTFPRVFTKDGGHARVETFSQHVVITALRLHTNSLGTLTNRAVLQSVKCGPLVELVGTLTEGGQRVVLQAQVKVDEFLGLGPDRKIDLTDGGTAHLQVTANEARFRHRSAIATATLKDGETLMLSPGPFSAEKQTVKELVPFNYLPGLANLFMVKHTVRVTNHAVFFITPRFRSPTAKP